MINPAETTNMTMWENILADKVQADNLDRSIVAYLFLVPFLPLITSYHGS